MDTSNEILDANINDNSHKPEIELIDSNKFILLFILTFGLYGIWWMYKSWNFFKERELLDIMPAARAIFAIFFMHSLFEKIKGFARAFGSDTNYSSAGLFVGYILLSLTSRLPEPFFLITFLSFIFFLQPLNALNYAIENSNSYRIKRRGFNNRQIVLIVIGSIVWILMIIGLMA